MSETKGPSVVDVLSKVSGISKEEVLKIRERVRDNHARLDACAGPHVFEDVTPEKIVGKEFVCKLCAGRVDSQARAWYERGREHETRRIAETERVLTCAFCGEAYPPGTPESNHEALTAHVKICSKHPMRIVERERDALRGDNEAQRFRAVEAEAAAFEAQEKCDALSAQGAARVVEACGVG